MITLIMALDLTFFPTQPNWYELDTSGIEWTLTYLGDQEAQAAAQWMVDHSQE